MRLCDRRRSGRIGLTMLIMTAVALPGCQSPKANTASRWRGDLSDVFKTPPITFHYDHGVLAGSYPDGEKTVAIEFDDVCGQLGHICLCGAGGFRIAAEAVEALRDSDAPLKRCEFTLISSRDHTVSDVIAFVLGCPRRTNSAANRYLIDNSITAPRREYHYYIAYAPTRTAVHIVYRKHLLIGHERMDALWKIETAYDRDPDSVSAEDVNRYRAAMRQMVQDVLFDRAPNLIAVTPIPYADFEKHLDAARYD